MNANSIIAMVVLAMVVIAVLYVLWRATLKETAPPPPKIEIPIKATSSWAAGQLKVEFYALPQAHRPDVDIDAIVKALDTKHGIESVNDHFKSRVYSPQNATYSYKYQWKHDNCPPPCPFGAYRDIHDQFVVLQEAHKKREHALAVAEQQYGFEQMESLRQQLVTETLSLVENTQSIKDNHGRQS